MLGDSISDKGWPACGEIDILELLGNDPTYVYGSLHSPNWDKTGSYHLPEGFHNDFHTYAVNWQPDYFEFSVDGHIYYTVHKWESNGEEQWAPFEGNNFFILLNLAVGGNWPGYPDDTTQFPQQFIVDYVRVWEIDWNNSDAQEFLQ